MKRVKISGLNVIVQSDTIVSIGEHIKISAENCGEGKVRIVIDAPKDLRILRSNVGTGWSGKKVRL